MPDRSFKLTLVSVATLITNYNYPELTRMRYTSTDMQVDSDADSTDMLGEIAAQVRTCDECEHELTKFAFNCTRFWCI
jgi:hypothetical protein